MQQIGVFGRGVTFVLLAWMGVIDLKERQIPSVILVIGSILSTVYFLLTIRDQWWINVAGLGVGLLFLMISVATREKLGYADSWIFCNLGLYLGIWNLLYTLIFTWIGVAVMGMCYLVKKGFRRDMEFPMIPFIAVGYGIMWIGELLG